MPADTPSATSKKWRIEVNPSWPHASRIYYNGEKVGSIRAVNFGISVDNPIPFIEFSIWTKDVEVVTQDDPPPGI